jgi:hypothetical protein
MADAMPEISIEYHGNTEREQLCSEHSRKVMQRR